MECFYCDCCETFSSWRDRQLRHLWHKRQGHEIKEAARLFACIYCTRSFPTQRMAGDHVARGHPELPKMYDCPGCPRTFLLSSTRDRHAASHRKPKERVGCKFCTLNFVSFDKMASHVGLVHWREAGQKEPSAKKGSPPTKKAPAAAAADQKSFECSFCDYFFANKRLLWNHHTEHNRCGHEIKPGAQKFLCPHCSRAFLTRRLVGVHVRAVHPEVVQDFNCKYCDRVFKHQIMLYRHQRNHKAIGDEPRVTLPPQTFKCKYCDLSFDSFGLMAAHCRSLHSQLPRPFVCETCGASFRTAEGRATHAKLHRDGAVQVGQGLREESAGFDCRFCHRSFDRFQKVAAHERQLHFKETGKLHPQHYLGGVSGGGGISGT